MSTPSSSAAICPHNCHLWVRLFDTSHPPTRHHPNCPLVDSTLIDVWRVSYDRSSYVMDREPNGDDLAEGETVTKERMHREIYENLPEFMGF